jgi:hypothetical protein
MSYWIISWEKYEKNVELFTELFSNLAILKIWEKKKVTLISIKKLKDIIWRLGILGYDRGRGDF